MSKFSSLEFFSMWIENIASGSEHKLWNSYLALDDDLLIKICAIADKLINGFWAMHYLSSENDS